MPLNAGVRAHGCSAVKRKRQRKYTSVTQRGQLMLEQQWGKFFAVPKVFSFFNNYWSEAALISFLTPSRFSFPDSRA
jgi:hypothetical protein